MVWVFVWFLWCLYDLHVLKKLTSYPRTSQKIYVFLSIIVSSLVDSLTLLDSLSITTVYSRHSSILSALFSHFDKNYMYTHMLGTVLLLSYSFRIKYCSRNIISKYCSSKVCFVNVGACHRTWFLSVHWDNAYKKFHGLSGHYSTTEINFCLVLRKADNSSFHINTIKRDVFGARGMNQWLRISSDLPEFPI